VDGHRRYADESEPGWYAGQSPYQAPAPLDGQSSYDGPGSTSNPYDSGVHERPSGAFRLPAEGGYGTPAPYVTPDPVTSSGSHALPALDSTDTRMPVRGPEYPTIRPGGATSLADAPPVPSSSMTTTYGGPSSSSSPAAEATTIVPPVAAADRARYGAEAARESIYRTRRPVAAVIVAILTVLLMVPVVLLLIQVTFVDDPAVRGIVPAVLLTFGLPLAGAGLYALTAGGSTGRDAWLRAPIVYLPIGLVLLLAAGLAVA
jgi:hypothetical protein